MIFVKLKKSIFKQEQKMIKAVIFDMDGLLIDSEPLWMEAEIELFSHLGLKLTPEDCKQMQGVKIPDVISHWFEVKPWQGMSLEEVERRLVERVNELIREKGQIQPGVRATLEFFRQRNIPMAVASSSTPDLIEMVVKKLGIEQYFEFLHSSMHERRGKPHPDIFLTAAKKLGQSPGDCLIFEDSLNGVIAGKKAGSTVVAVPYPENFNDPGFDIADMKLRSLEEWDQEKFDSIQVKV